MYILAKPDSQQVYPYSFNKLREDNPNTSFRTGMTDVEYSEWHMFPVQPTNRPEVDNLVYRVEEGMPTLVGNQWQQTWSTVAMTAQEIALETHKQQAITNRNSRAYLTSTDWYVIRKTETGVEIPEDILEKRAQARTAIV
jgi:hypothetical protein